MKRDPMPSEPRRFSIDLPRPLWIGVATLAIFVVAVGLQFGLPIYRQQAAIQEIERIGGKVVTQDSCPEWLRAKLGDQRTRLFDEITKVRLDDTQATDVTLSICCLTTVEVVWLDNTRASLMQGLVISEHSPACDISCSAACALQMLVWRIWRD